MNRDHSEYYMSI